MANEKVLTIACHLLKSGARVDCVKRYRRDYRLISLCTGYNSGSYILLSLTDYNRVLDMMK